MSVSGRDINDALEDKIAWLSLWRAIISGERPDDVLLAAVYDIARMAKSAYARDKFLERLRNDKYMREVFSTHAYRKKS